MMNSLTSTFTMFMDKPVPFHPFVSCLTSYGGFIQFVEERVSHDWCCAIDASKMNDELNWQSDETFETGIQKNVEWYLNT